MTELPNTLERRDLEEAFSAFNQASAQLTGAYHDLQHKVEQLTAELAIANGELRRQFLEKEALSQRLGRLLETLPGGVIVLDQAGMVVEVNPAALQQFDEPLLGKSWHTVVARKLHTTLTPDTWELITEGGITRRVHVSSSLLGAHGGRILLVQDITEAYRLQQELQRHQRLSAMGEMAAGLAHQLRTPLATALLYTSHLSKPDLPLAERTRFTEKALARLRHLESLLQDMLWFVKGEAVAQDEFDIAALLRELAQIVEPQMKQRGLRFESVDRSGGARVVGTRQALGGALVNLLENAMQACQAGDTVSLRCEAQRGDGVIVTVSDSGQGIELEVQERMFEPFYTTKDEGTGLGLAIVRSVVEAHGGAIEVRSRPGAGSSFELRLPACAAAHVDALLIRDSPQTPG
ncbi:MAG: sensor histidine kinase [Burkholderiales bacterium]